MTSSKSVQDFTKLKMISTRHKSGPQRDRPYHTTASLWHCYPFSLTRVLDSLSFLKLDQDLLNIGIKLIFPMLKFMSDTVT